MRQCRISGRSFTIFIVAESAIIVNFDGSPKKIIEVT